MPSPNNKIKQIKLPNGTVLDMRDNYASHYIGTTTTLLTEGTTTATVSIGGVNVTAVPHDWVRYVATNGAIDSFIYLGAENGGWVQFAEGNDVVDVQVAGTSVLNGSTRVANVTEVPADIIGTTNHMVLKTGVGAAAPTNDADVANKKYVDDAITGVSGGMVFKGTIGAAGDNPTITELPTAGADNVGFVYKVITAGTYSGQACKIGDMWICAKTGTSTYAWTYVPSGDDVDVTEVNIDASTGLKTDVTDATHATGNAPITSSGTISLNLANTSGVSEASASVAKIGVGVDSNNALSANIDKVVAADITAASPGTTSGVVSGAEIKSAVNTLISGKQDAITPGTGLKWNTSSGTTLDHSNSTTAKTDAFAVRSIKYDAQGHITDSQDCGSASVTGVTNVSNTVNAIDSIAPSESQTPTGSSLQLYSYNQADEELQLWQVGVSTGTNVTLDTAKTFVTPPTT